MECMAKAVWFLSLGTFDIRNLLMVVLHNQTMQLSWSP